MNDTQTIKIAVTQEDLTAGKCAEYCDVISDYPMYASTSNLCRADIALLAKLMHYEFGNESTLEVTITVKEAAE